MACDNINSEAIDPCLNWAAIPGFSGYEASTSGDILDLRRNKLLNQSRAKRGLKVNIGKTTAMVHDLVLRAFTGVPPRGYRPKHVNGNKLDNRLENLAWAGKASGESSKRRSQ